MTYGDGVADVDQIPAAELAKRKMVVALRSVKEPPRLQSAVAALWGAYLAVLATLRLQFAQTAAIDREIEIHRQRRDAAMEENRRQGEAIRLAALEDIGAGDPHKVPLRLTAS